MTRNRKIIGGAVALATGLSLAVGVPVAYGQPVAHDRVVSDDPANFTPDIMNGEAKAVIQLGNKVIVGGTFTTVQAAGSNTNITRTRLLAFDATTGAIDTRFAPAVNGQVLSLAPGPGGDTVFVGGAFSNVGGRAAQRLALLDIDDGSHVPGFATPTINGQIKDMEVSGGRLYLAGSFSRVGTATRTAVAALNPSTGAVLADFNPVIAGNHDGHYQGVLKIAVSPNGERLVAIGGFGTVNGERREQIAMFDLTTSPARLADWYTPRYEASCFFVFYTYMRDVAFAPDSSYFVVGTTGRHYAGTLCDAVARFETYASGTDLRETWLDYTGGDSVISVTATQTAVYAGGHFRWWNNPFCPGRGEAPCAGAVGRDGVAALDPVNGLPLRWNPGRVRGYGIYQFFPTAAGLWAVSDTSGIGGEQHGRIAFLPLAGGTVLPAQRTGAVPGDVFQAGADGVRHRAFDGASAGPPEAADAGGVAWGDARGAFMINDTLYTGWSDGRFLKRSFDGATFGPPAVIDTADRIVADAAWHAAVPGIGGMFYADGRIYYTRAGSPALHYRYFTPESDVVGATEFTAAGNLAGIDWARVGGMFLTGGAFYFVTTDDGRLHRATWSGGAPVAGSATTVGTATDWHARAVFLSTAGAPANTPPTAAFDVDCDALACSFDAAGSGDADGAVSSYAWNFGDGTTAAGVAAGHAFAAAGSYDVTLTVTDNQGATGSVTRSVSVTAAPPPASSIAFRATAGVNTNATRPTVTVPGAVRAGDGLLLVLTAASTSNTVTGPAGWTEVGRVSTNGARSVLWRKVAAASDAGAAVRVTLSTRVKADLRVLAYEGTSASNPVARFASMADPATTVSHTSPTVEVAAGGRWVVTAWSDKSSSTTAWTAPGGIAVRATAAGTGGGRVTALLADSGGPVATGGYGNLTATTDAASRAMVWTIVLAPA